MNPDQIYIVVPCYNDKKVIRKTVTDLINCGYSIIVVNDGSTQNILDEVADLHLTYALHRMNLGQGAALQTGIEIALKKGAMMIIHFDSDGQHSADDIPKMIEPLLENKADIVIGSRFLNQRDIEAIPFNKRLLLRVARIVNWCLTGMWLSDAHNGFRAMTRYAGEKIKIKENRMGHASEILIQVRHQKLRYAECPTHIVYTPYSRAKGQSAFNSINIVIDLLLNKIFA